MIVHPDVGAGETERHPSGGIVSGRKQRDLNSIAEVALLAEELAQGNTRRITMASIAEIRAVALLAVQATLRVTALETRQ